MRRTLLLLFTGLLLVPFAVSGQEPERTDSLELEVRELRAKLDSLQRMLERLIREGQDTSQVTAELAALRAAAQAAAAGAQTGIDTTAQESRTRALSLTNPEISVTGDVVGYYAMPADERTRAVFTEWEALLPFHQEGANGRTWQEAAIDMEEGRAGMYLLGTFAASASEAPASSWPTPPPRPARSTWAS